MKRTVLGAVTVAGVVALTGVLHAASGVVIVTKSSSDSGTQTHQVQLDANHMRAEMAGGAGDTQVVIFDGAKQVLDIVSPAKKTYSEITQADADKLGAQVSGAMAQMQAQMANLPPEQRAQIEAMMKGRGAGAMGGAPAKPEYKKVGTDTVGKWTCDKYEGYTNGQKVSEVCTVDPKALGFTVGDFAVTRQMAEFFGRIMPQMSSRMFAIGSLEAQGYAGIPVRNTQYVMGRTITTEVVEVTRGTIPETAFQVPAGFEKQPFMGGMGRGRQ